MKIAVERLHGDATISIYNKQGDLIHVESISGKTTSLYMRSIPVDVVEYGHSVCVFSGEIEYKVVA